MFAAIHIPNFALQCVLRLQPEARTLPVALVDPALPKPLIVAVNAPARVAGAVEGLTPSQALARCAELAIKPRSLAQEEAGTNILLQTAYAFSPNIESTGPGICTMDLKGLDLEDAAKCQLWAEIILERLAGFYFEARLGIGPTPEVALLAARAAQSVLRVKDPAQFISRLPVAALEPDPATAEILRRWGIQKAGQFLALEKTKVAERLGAEALPLFDRVAMHHVRPLEVIIPPEQFDEQMEFEQEIETVEPLLFVLRRFVEQLARRLDAVYLVVAELQLRLGLFSGEKYERVIHIPSPTGNVETLFRTLRTHLETVRTESPIASLQLTAKPAKPEAHQFGLFEASVRNPNQFAETLARLGALCGSENVGTPVPEATHRPDAFRMKTPDFSVMPEPAETLLAGTPRRGVRGRPGGPSLPSELGGRGKQGLALRRFRPALSARVEFSSERPSAMRSPVFSGRLSKTQGPYLYSGDWWEEHRWGREEWDVETLDGALYRIFRSTGGCFIEGVYD